MIFDAVQRAHTVTATNLATDLAALCTAKSVTNPGTITLVKRQKAETFIALGSPLPALGIYGLRAVTQAKDQGKRDSLVTVVWDFYIEGTDPTLIAKQAELVAESVLRTVDRLAASGDGLYGAGELAQSVTVEMSDNYQEAEELKWFQRAVVTAPVHDRDEGV